MLRERQTGERQRESRNEIRKEEVQTRVRLTYTQQTSTTLLGLMSLLYL